MKFVKHFVQEGGGLHLAPSHKFSICLDFVIHIYLYFVVFLNSQSVI